MPPKNSRQANSRPSKSGLGSSRSSNGNRLSGPAPLASLGWLLGAAATAVAIGAAGAYLVLCVLFYQNQAMMIFHPSPKITTTPASVGLKYQAISFGPSTSTMPRLTGWWIPAATDSAAKNPPAGNPTILYLHGASGSLSDTVPQIKALHTLGVNIFAIDYLGFGNSTGSRPTEQLSDRNTLAAWRYLTTVRNLPPASLIVFGEGAGATFAVHLAARHQVAGLVLAGISPTAHTVFKRDQRARLLPLFLLAKERMNPVPGLKQLQTPKLFLDWAAKSPAPAQDTTEYDFRQASAPKQLASLPDAAPTGIAAAVQPFLRQILPAAK